MPNLIKLRCVVLQVINPHLHHQDAELADKNLRELELLIDTAGGEVIDRAVQHRVQPHPATYVGGGKVEWLKEVVEREKIDIVVLNNVAKSGQMFRLEQMLWEINPKIKVWDRVDLILAIFDQHANTLEAKLQIQLARIHHLGPRIYGLGGTVLSRQGAGVGTRGLGETNTELEKRKIKAEKQQIQQQLSRLEKDRLHRIHQRQEQGTKTVALVGYTSAGKTTLFNTLTGKDRQTHQSLFTTLDSVVGKMKTVGIGETLISDTIGFIDDLPPALIQAFRSTLLESLQASTLLHVIDASDPFLHSKFEVVENILIDLKIQADPILIFNKVDLISDDDRQLLDRQFSQRSRVFISAVTGEGIENLKKKLN